MHSKLNIKSILIIAIIMFLFCQICTFGIMRATAATKCSLCGVEHDLGKLGLLQRPSYDMSCIIYGGTTVDGTLEAALKFDTSSSTFSDLWNNVAGSYYGILQKFGELLCVIYMLIELMNHQMDDLLNLEHVMKFFIKTVIGLLIIRIGFDVVGRVMDISIIAFSQLVTATTANGSPMADMCPYDKLAKMDFFESVGELFGLLSPYIAMLVATIVLNIVVWARVLDIVVRTIFAPIGMADLMVDGTRSNGMRYLKKLLSSGLQGVVLMAALKGFGIIMASMSSHGSYAIQIALSFTLISAMFKANQIADDLVGL